MWHYEYKLEDREFRFEADTFEDCLAEVLSARITALGQVPGSGVTVSFDLVG